MPSTQKIVHPKLHVVIRAKNQKLGALSVDDCKALIGWTEEPSDENWGSEFVLRDRESRKIRLLNNPKNRPFKLPLAERYALEHLRGKWALNLQSIVIDKYGNVPQGQHRLCGFILAEQMRQKEPSKWGKKPLMYETLLGFGVEPTNDVSDTFDIGANRSLADVLYRRHRFKKNVTDKEQKKVTKILSSAIRLVWLRVGGKQVSYAPHFPHSEATEFFGNHPKILQAVEQILELDGGREKYISALVSSGHASALYYLMALSQSWEDAHEFWSQLATGEGLTKGDPALTLRQSLTRMESMGGSKRDIVIGTIIKAWNLWVNDKKAAAKDIKMSKKKVGDKFIIAEFPRIGGIDSDVEAEVPLTKQQLHILHELRSLRGEVTYAKLHESTGLTPSTLSKSISAKDDPHSLVGRKLVLVNQYEAEEGEQSPIVLSLSPAGKKFFG